MLCNIDIITCHIARQLKAGDLIFIGGVSIHNRGGIFTQGTAGILLTRILTGRDRIGHRKVGRYLAALYSLKHLHDIVVRDGSLVLLPNRIDGCGLFAPIECNGSHFVSAVILSRSGRPTFEFITLSGRSCVQVTRPRCGRCCAAGFTVSGRRTAIAIILDGIRIFRRGFVVNQVHVF